MSALLAYFDPGSGSLLLQVLVGGSAGLIVFARYLWESAPSFLRSRKAEANRIQQKVTSSTVANAA